MQLYLLRHGDALDAGYTDAHRPLSPLGEEQSAAVASALRSLSILPQLIISSPLLRARQMAQIVHQELRSSRCISSEYLAPGSDERQLFHYLNELKKPSAVLVGHEPQLREVASLLCTGTKTLRLELRKASIVAIASSLPVGPGSGTLSFLLPYEHMRALAK